MLCKVGISFILVLVLHNNVLGQVQETESEDSEITGVVLSAQDGEPIPGVSILILGTASGTTTDIDGFYSLTAPSDGILVFSSVGYVTVEEPINNRTTINIQMEEAIALLDELIVTGYSAQRRGDITGAVSSVNIESIERQTSASVLERLDGRVSGVTVESSGSPGSRNTVRIRGVSSFQNNDPLYIIDGTPVQDSFANWLNPNDIESIQVLKDASTASIYGSRANNGVIIIETKKGRAGVPQVSINLRTGIATPARGYDDFLITDALEYHEVVKRSYENAGDTVPINIYGDDPNNPTIPEFIWPNDGEEQTYREGDIIYFGENSININDYTFPNTLIMPASTGTNWFGEVFGPALQQDYNIAVSGGSSDYNYNVSFNYLDQEGTAIYNRFQRGSIRVNTEFHRGNFTIGENISVALDESFGGMPNDPGGYAEDGILGKNILMQPIVPVYDIAGNFAGGKAVGLGNQGNPVKQAWGNKDDIARNARIFGNIFGRMNLQNNLVVTSRLGFNLSENSNRGYNPITPENSEPNFTNSINENNNVNRDWTWSNTVQYLGAFADQHNIDVLVGHEANQVVFRGMGGSMSDLLNTDISSRYLQDALGDPGTKNVNSSGFRASLLSFFGKVDYNYAQKYFISATVRRDGSSRLGSTNQWGTFPAFSAGWRVSNESFMQDNDLISNLMFRAGWGITGNQNIPAGSTVNQYGGGIGDVFYNISGDGNSVVQGFRQTIRGNPDLKWEQNESVNVGLDLEMFDGRLNFALDVYQRDTKDLLFAPALPATAGVANPPVVNIGEMRNTGFDFTIGTRGSFSSNLNWTLTFNGSHYKNEIRKIDGTSDFFYGTNLNTRTDFQVINQIGSPLGSFYGYKTNGLFMNEQEVNAHASQAGAEPGRIRFVDVNGDGDINADDQTIIGDPHPDFIGGLDFGLQYKNWDFNATLFASIGNDIYEMQKEFYIFRRFSTTVRRDLLTDSAIVENGQVVNSNAKYPQISQTDTFSGAVSDFYVEDGSYLRLRNLQVGYTVPAGILPGLRNMRVYVQAENLFTITGYPGLDPTLPAANINSGGANITDQYRGIDRGAYPSSRTISIGINATF